MISSVAKIGDKVRCIDLKWLNATTVLKLGKVYTVETVRPCNDSYEYRLHEFSAEGYFYSFRFEIVPANIAALGPDDCQKVCDIRNI